MIPKANKFPTRVQFLSFRDRARQLTTPHLRIMFEKRVNNETVSIHGARLSVIVPIKVNKRAVIRNHFRRLTYNTAWQFLSNKKIDCIIVFKPLALLKGKEADDHITQEVQQIVKSIEV